MHLEFEALHPFQDGNGRIGRSLYPTTLVFKNNFRTSFLYKWIYGRKQEEYIDTMRNVSK